MLLTISYSGSAYPITLVGPLKPRILSLIQTCSGEVLNQLTAIDQRLVVQMNSQGGFSKNVRL